MNLAAEEGWSEASRQLTAYPAYPTMEHGGRARRGASGALNPQTAIAGLNPSFEAGPMGRYPLTMVLKVGSHAAQTCEPRQVRKEATVNEALRVPWVRLTGAVVLDMLTGFRSMGGARPLNLPCRTT
jgi:hypothetical protein